MTDYRDLIGRLEKAEGADRELDALIGKALKIVDERAVPGGVTGFGYVDRGQWACATVAPVTASLDAALALVERVLPGCAFVINGFDVARKPERVRVVKAHLSGWIGFKPYTGALGEAPTAPLAVLLALLRTLQHREADRG